MIIKHQKEETAIRVKKVYSELSQALKMSEANNGYVGTWDLGTESSVENTRRFMQKYLIPYFRDIQEYSTGITKAETGTWIGANGVNYLYNHSVGISVIVHPNDVPAVVFAVSPFVQKSIKSNNMSKSNYRFIILNGKLLPYGYKEGVTRDEIKNGYSYAGVTVSCGNNGAPFPYHACAYLLMRDGWQIKDDYPW